VPEPTTNEFLFSRERLNRASVEFLKVDLETTLIFLHIARQTDHVSRQQRNLRAARKAYDTILRFMERVELSDEDIRALIIGLERLRSEMKELGEAFQAIFSSGSFSFSSRDGEVCPPIAQRGEKSFLE